MTQDRGARGGTFYGEMDRCIENQGWTTACTVKIIVCPNVMITARMQERIAQIKRVRAGSPAIVDWPIVARTCILKTFFVLFPDAILSSSGVALLSLSFVFVFFASILAEAPSFIRGSICMHPDSHMQLTIPGWTLDISLCENSSNVSQPIDRVG